MTELYLIAHKVRGEPAFDIAQRLQIGDEEGWIIPTSGHRAYPYWITELANFGYVFRSDGSVWGLIDPMPPDLPDHYRVTAAPRKAATAEAAANLLAALGLGKPKAAEPFKRRV